ncbi:MAG: class I tRNA ligase family protein, partial [Gemmatimonadota bacterium]|nr:class I tRNA ligase family protein [Gemmatimonadota bacterium]
MTYEPLGFTTPEAFETGILERWHQEQLFQRTIEATRDGEPFVFYEGPPTANGLPHNGHVLTRVVKD